MPKYYVWENYDHFDLHPVWEVRKHLFWVFSSFHSKFLTEGAAQEVADKLNEESNA